MGNFLDACLQAWTKTTVDFVQPASGATVVVKVEANAWMPLGLPVFIQGGGAYTVVSRPKESSVVVLQNTGATGNTAPGATVLADALLSPGGGGGGGGQVASVFGRTGTVVAAANDYKASDVANDSTVSGPTVAAALNALKANSVSSVYGRTGAVTATLGDYGSNKITNFSSAPGSTVDAALTYLRFGPLCPFSRSASGGISLTTSDRRRLIRVTSGPSTVTVPTNASQAFLEGDVLTFLTENADAITFTGAGGVTVHQPSTYSTNAWTYYYLKSLGADEWVVTQEAMAYHPLSIINADVNTAAAIAGTKISPNFGSQNVVTTGTMQAAAFGDSSTGLVYSASSLSS